MDIGKIFDNMLKIHPSTLSGKLHLQKILSFQNRELDLVYGKSLFSHPHQLFLTFVADWLVDWGYDS